MLPSILPHAVSILPLPAPTGSFSIPPLGSIHPPVPPIGSIFPPALVTAHDIQEFMPLVRQVVARFVRKLPPNVLREDLMAAGMFGLADALRRSGSDRGPTFEAYARIRIRGTILDELRTQDWLTRRARKRITGPVVEGQPYLSSIIPMEDLSEAHRGRLYDSKAPSPLDTAQVNLERDALIKAVEQLRERERLIVTLHYFHGVQLKDIATELGISLPRASQIHARAVEKLRKTLGSADGAEG
jgi:RNA polymerase sigma factor for flagellar operon FliA